MTQPAAVITVDGPGGAGKGTLSQALAQHLGWHLLDSGAIYRLLALAALQARIDLQDESALVTLACKLNARFINQNVLLDNADVSRQIRAPEIASAASQLAALPFVRQALLTRQRSFRAPPGLVADGRDMGTVVFPDAPVKIFLDASTEERARRRMQQLQQQGFSVNFDSLLAEIQQRDDRDRHRAVAPLAAASDALMLDSTLLTIDQVVAQALAYARARLQISDKPSFSPHGAK